MMRSFSTRTALKVTLLYVLFSSLWIIFSDKLLGQFITNPALLVSVESIKGETFVIISAIGLFFLLKIILGMRQEAEIALNEQRLKVETSTRKMAAIVESSSDAIIGLDGYGNIASWNSAAEQMYGYSARQVLRKSVSLIIAPHQWEESERAWKIVRNGERVNTLESIHIRKDGYHINVSMTVSPVYDASGKVQGISVIARDITSHKQREMELEAVASMANALRSASSQEEMLPVIVQQAQELLGATGAAVSMSDHTPEEQVVELGTGTLSYLTGQHVTENSAIIDSISLPLVASSEEIGMLWVQRPSTVNENELRLLKAIGDIAANALHRARLFETTTQHLQRLAALHTIDEAISSSLDLSMTLWVLLEQVATQLQVDAADVLLLNPRSQTLDYAARYGFHYSSLPRLRQPLEEFYGGQAIRQEKVVSIPDINELEMTINRQARTRPRVGTGTAAYRVDPIESLIERMRAEKFQAYYAVPLVAKEQVKGILDIYSRKPLNPTTEWLSFLEALGKQAAIAIDNASLFKDLQRSNLELAQAYDITLEGWMRTLSLRDNETEDHTQRVADMTVNLAKNYGLNPDQLINVRRGALLHDIGKMGVPDSILLKPGSLTETERQIMRMHPVYAYELLSPIAYLRPALDIPYCHHEKWDGSGYPRGLHQKEIPLAARLFSVADVWDALRSDRPYRSAWSEERTLDYLHTQSGQHFDPEVVELFLGTFCDI